MAVNKKKATRILHKIYKALKEEDVKMRLNRAIDPIFGYLTLDTRGRYIMEINPIKKGSRGGLMSTILHECLHLVDITLPEYEIQELEIHMFEYLSDRQLTNLLKRVANVCLKR